MYNFNIYIHVFLSTAIFYEKMIIFELILNNTIRYQIIVQTHGTWYY